MKTKNALAWVAGLLVGMVGIAISAAIFVIIAMNTGYIYGAVAILCGALSGGIVGITYKLAKGKILNPTQAKIFLWVLTVFGLLGVLAAYVSPYIIYPVDGGGFIGYVKFMEFDIKDVLFIVIGAYGGRLVGMKLAQMMGKQSTLIKAGLVG
jgi:hypothetical protein